MKKHLFTLVYLFFLVLNASSQTILVLDKTTLKPLPGVSISGKNPNLTTSTNTEGKAILNNARPDSLQFSFVGYRTQVLSFAEAAKQQFRILLNAKSFSLGEVVVAASRFEEKIEQVPQQVQVLNNQELQFMNQPTTADVLQQTGTVLVQKSQLGGGSPIIRGFEANKVLLVVDGVRLNNAIYRGGHLQNSLTLDNSILDRVEVVFGPGSVVYGSDALGGVMHFYTRNPILGTPNKINLQANAFLRYGTAAQEKTGHVDFNIGLHKVGSLTSFSFSDFSDLKQGENAAGDYGDWGKRLFYVERQNGQDIKVLNPDPYRQKRSGYKQYDLLQKFVYAPNRQVAHGLNLQYSTSSNIPRYDRLTLLAGSLPRYAEWYYGPQERFMSAYTLNLKAARLLYDKAQFILAYQHITESRHDRSFQKLNRNSRIENLQVLTLNADLEKKLKANNFRFGLESTYNAVNSTAFAENIDTNEKSSLDTRYPGGGSDMQSAAVYVTHTYLLKPNLILNDGIRYSKVRLQADFGENTFFPFPFQTVTQNSSALNGNIGVIWQAKPSWRFSLLGSSGFRVPNVDDLSKVFESVPGNIVVPNPDLKPEYTYNGEISITKNIKQRLQLALVGYYTFYHNAITTQPGTYNGQDSIVYDGQKSRVTRNVNATQAYIYGSSLQLSADITPFLSLTSSLNYTYGRIKTDSTNYPLDHIPPVFGKTSLQLSVKKIRSEFYALYNGWKKVKDYNLLGEDNFAYATPEGMPAWNTLNIRISYQVTKNLQIQAAIENILDRQYRVFASNINGTGRNFILTLRGNI